MRKVSIGVLVCLLAIALCIPATNVKAGASKDDAKAGYWTPGSPTDDPNSDGYLIQAIHHDGEGLIDGTVTIGTAKNKRQARKAAKALAKSLNEGGQGFKWEPGCEGTTFVC